MENPRIYSYTVIRTATADFADKTPYCAALIEMPDGTRREAILEGYIDGMEIKIGREVYLIEGSEGKYTL